MWKKFLRNYFTFNRKERNGLIVLFSLMLALTFWPEVYSRLRKESSTDFTAFKQSIDSFQAALNHVEDHSFDTTIASPAALDQLNSDKGKPGREVVLFPFDPNILDREGWRTLGISEKTISTILNYRSKGGRFFKKDDLRKIYGFSEVDYARLEPFIQLSSNSPEVKTFAKETAPQASAEKKLPVELNSADSLQLITLNGIGPVLSSRILRYRNKLGGFVSPDQLKEVYGITTESFEVLKHEVIVDEVSVHKIHINEISLAELKQHPYFKHPLASMIISYREQHGPYQKAEDLMNIEIMRDSVFRKIMPYVAF